MPTDMSCYSTLPRETTLSASPMLTYALGHYRLSQYTELQPGPACPRNDRQTSTKDACDNNILYALERNAAHALVTEDQGLHRKAREYGLSDRVYFIQSAHDWISRLHEPCKIELPHIEDVELHTLTDQIEDLFFDSLRDGYDGFNDWFRSKAIEGRRAWVYREDGRKSISALCIYTVQSNERINISGDVLAGDSLKLCTFKVGEEVRGRKVGELFLKAAFQHASNHRCEHIFLTVNDDRQTQLKGLIEDFGFRHSGFHKEDSVYVKAHPAHPPALEIDSFQYVLQFYPHYISNDSVQKFLVPIQPHFHNILFPDYLIPRNSLPPNHPQRHVGNAIKLAYLCHTPSKRPRPGDIVIFYRSRDMRAATTIGIVEKYLWSNSAVEIAQIVSRRTVYSEKQIEELAQSETKVMLFRQIRHFENAVTFDKLKRMRVVCGPIQSIIKISDESFSKILRST